MVALAVYTVLLVINCAVSILVDMWFNYAPALHDVEYESNHYSVEKKLAVKKFQKEGYIGL